MRKILGVAAAALALTVASPAAAAQTIDISVGGFTHNYGTGTPASSATGSLTYDYSASASLLTVTGFSLDIGSTHYGLTDLLTSLSGAGPAGGLTGQVYGNSWALTLGYNAAGNAVNELSALSRDFLLVFFFNPQTGAVANNNSGTFLYSTGGTLQTASSFNGTSVSVSAVPSGVPEPATWAMMLLGFGGIGVMMRRKRQRTLQTA